jgi:hypothetical protein
MLLFTAVHMLQLTLEGLSRPLSTAARRILTPLEISVADRSLWSILPSVSEHFRDLPPEHHAALDDFVAILRARNVLAPWTFYARGFGRVRRCVELARDVKDTMSAHRSPTFSPALLPKPTTPIQLSSSVDGREFAHVAEGAFPTPSLADALPPRSHAVRFQLVTPTSWLTPSPTPARRPMVILLPGTGEHGFQRRRHLLAYPLAQAGIGSVILEGPFYGARRDPAQFGSKLLALSHLPVLGRATIEEATVLVTWLRARTPEEVLALPALLPRGRPISSPAPASTAAGAGTGAGGGGGAPSTLCAPLANPGSLGGGHAATLCTGVSMGGLHAAMTCSMLPSTWGDVSFVSWLGPPSGVGVFTRGALARACDWGAFAGDTRADTCEDGRLSSALEDLGVLLGGGGGGRGGGPPSRLPTLGDALALAPHWPGIPPPALHAALVGVAKLLRMTDVTQFPAPARPDAGSFFLAGHDRYVPLQEGERELWGWVGETWRGCSISTLAAGHVSGSLFHTRAYVEALQRAVSRL